MSPLLVFGRAVGSTGSFHVPLGTSADSENPHDLKVHNAVKNTLTVKNKPPSPSSPSPTATAEQQARGGDYCKTEPCRPYPLSQFEILSTWTFWYFFVVFLVLQSPGFGVKILVTSIMETLYGTSAAEGALVSSVFLISYSVTRFLAGFIPSFMRVRDAFLYGGIIQGGTLLLVPATIDNTTSFYVFVALITVSGNVLAVLATLGPIIIREIWGEVNFGKAVGSIVFTSGLAVWIGPITSFALVRDEDEDGKLSASSSIFFYGFGGLSITAGLAMAFVKPYPYKHVSK
jgi:hypothetical protein